MQATPYDPDRAMPTSSSADEDDAGASGPRIVVHEPRGSLAPAVSMQRSPHDALRAQSSDESLSTIRESSGLDALVDHQPDQDASPSSIPCTIHASFDDDLLPLVEHVVFYNDANSYQEIQKYVRGYIEGIQATDLTGKSLNFKCGSCTVTGDDVEESSVLFNTQEDWSNVCTILTNY